MKLGLFILISVVFFEGLEFLFDLPSLNIFLIIGLGIGAYLLREHPLLNKGFPRPVEIGVATLLIGAFVLHFGFVITVPAFEAQNEANQPCSSKSLESQCYNLSKDTCLSVWHHYKADCTADAQATTRGATQLVGAGIRKCVQKKFLKHMSFNQRNESSDLCREYFSSLSH